MTAINITAINVLDNPTLFINPFQFEIQYECLQDLQHDLEWKLTYVGSAESEKYDQELDSVLVGPVVRGQYRFIFQADPPDHSKLPQDDIVGVTVLLLTCSYQSKEFIRVGYYVNNEYMEEELRETPPEKAQIDRLSRSILADKPRVTRFPVEFDPVEAVPVMAGEGQPEGNGGDAMFTGMQQDFQQGLDLQQQQQQQQQGFMQEQQPSMFGAQVAGAVDMEA
ncbi:anti-silence-domain-containing protein [Coccomyxa subellipsoidea C-169]|uniref:Anti-silence-domain-containing protein n=1 Tax=Coccomyxa subellipsoidea (strain C-169) TaxID=574566 RepID=I0YKC2_COCSC|nr:anti-silence-domain-containing protein [Coccomyxa subellipsoidea C-169]EIE18841.1 anti-silence-domain-containing protein [Coccomyxa subellipsoidea C-169]|eukprot:XP_005643385.1 anti-silence-domain-containing protein [Coccomyxa subellipsoidea C-169]